MNLTKLAELAKAKTPGPWRVSGGPADAVYVLAGVDDYLTGPLSRQSNAAFIAAAGSVPPETWEALARVVEAARDVQHEWDQLGPTGDANTLAAHRALREALAALEAAPE